MAIFNIIKTQLELCCDDTDKDSRKKILQFFGLQDIAESDSVAPNDDNILKKIQEKYKEYSTTYTKQQITSIHEIHENMCIDVPFIFQAIIKDIIINQNSYSLAVAKEWITTIFNYVTLFNLCALKLQQTTAADNPQYFKRIIEVFTKDKQWIIDINKITLGFGFFQYAFGQQSSLDPNITRSLMLHPSFVSDYLKKLPASDVNKVYTWLFEKPQNKEVTKELLKRPDFIGYLNNTIELVCESLGMKWISVKNDDLILYYFADKNYPEFTEILLGLAAQTQSASSSSSSTSATTNGNYNNGWKGYFHNVTQLTSIPLISILSRPQNDPIKNYVIQYIRKILTSSSATTRNQQAVIPCYLNESVDWVFCNYKITDDNYPQLKTALQTLLQLGATLPDINDLFNESTSPNLGSSLEKILDLYLDLYLSSNNQNSNLSCSNSSSSSSSSNNNSPTAIKIKQNLLRTAIKNKNFLLAATLLHKGVPLPKDIEFNQLLGCLQTALRHFYLSKTNSASDAKKRILGPAIAIILIDAIKSLDNRNLLTYFKDIEKLLPPFIVQRFAAKYPSQAVYNNNKNTIFQPSNASNRPRPLEVAGKKGKDEVELLTTNASSSCSSNDAAEELSDKINKLIAHYIKEITRNKPFMDKYYNQPQHDGYINSSTQGITPSLLKTIGKILALQTATKYLQKRHSALTSTDAPITTREHTERLIQTIGKKEEPLVVIINNHQQETSMEIKRLTDYALETAPNAYASKTLIVTLKDGFIKSDYEITELLQEIYAADPAEQRPQHTTTSGNSASCGDVHSANTQATVEAQCTTSSSSSSSSTTYRH